MKVTIDGQSIEVESGTTILQAARMIGGESVPPAMCYYSKLKGSGGKCRACLVEVSKGSDADPRAMPKLMASCVHGVMDRGDHSNISTCLSKAITNEFSGNMIDVCPVGALTDKTFRFKQRVWFNKPYNAHRDCDKCCGKTTLWMFGQEIQRVTGRKDEFHEVEEFICNECRFEHKVVADWTIEGPRRFEKDSVINQNNYTKPLQTVHIATENNILRGRDQDRNKISMPAVPFKEEEKVVFKQGNI